MSEPLWREEIPIRSADEQYVTRRQLAKFLGLTSLGMFVGNLWILARAWRRRPLLPPSRVIARAGEIPVGGVKLFNYPGASDPCLLIRTGEDAYVAYSQKCTHLSCAVIYARARDRIECPCHHGVFAVDDGRVLAGPPPRPLPRVVLRRRGAELVALRVVQGVDEGGDDA